MDPLGPSTDRPTGIGSPGRPFRFTPRVAIPMNVQSTRQPLSAVESQWLAVGIFEDSTEPPISLRDSALGELVGRLLSAKELSGSLGDSTPLLGPHAPATDGVLVFGLGKRE